MPYIVCVFLKKKCQDWEKIYIRIWERAITSTHHFRFRPRLKSCQNIIIFWSIIQTPIFLRRKYYLSCGNLILRVFFIQLIRIFFVQLIKRWLNILQIYWIYEWHIMPWQFFNHKTCWACIDFDCYRGMFWTLHNVVSSLFWFSYIVTYNFYSPRLDCLDIGLFFLAIFFPSFLSR